MTIRSNPSRQASLLDTFLVTLRDGLYLLPGIPMGLAGYLFPGWGFEEAFIAFLFTVLLYFLISSVNKWKRWFQEMAETMPAKWIGCLAVMGGFSFLLTTVISTSSTYPVSELQYWSSVINMFTGGVPLAIATTWLIGKFGR